MGPRTTDDLAAADPGLTATDSKPTREASAAVRGKNPARGGSNAVDKAIALGNGVALPPLEAPEAIKKMIEAGNGIARTPYKWGGGHGKWQDTGYDCSGSVSFVLAAAGLLTGPLASGPLMSLGRARQGQVGHDLDQPGPRLPRGGGRPLRHLRAARSPARAGSTRCAPRTASWRGIPPVSRRLSRLGVPTP